MFTLNQRLKVELELLDDHPVVGCETSPWPLPNSMTFVVC